MLPYSTQDLERKPKTSSFSGVLNRTKSQVLSILCDKNSRSIFIFLCINLSFAFVELFYGFYSNSLGLISDSFHMFFDCTALFAGLVAAQLSKRNTNDKYTYGYVRADVIAGLLNSFALICIALQIICSATGRFINPPVVEHERLMLVSVMGLFVNFVGVYFFHEHHAGGHHNCSHNHSHGQCNKHNKSGKSLMMQGVFLHILADTLGSVGVIVSTFLMEQFGWMRADPICSFMIGTLIFTSCIPLFKSSLKILMHRIPEHLEYSLTNCMYNVEKIEGVYRVYDAHFWTLCAGVHVGNVKILISPTANARFVQEQAKIVYNRAGVDELYIHIDYSDM